MILPFFPEKLRNMIPGKFFTGQKHCLLPPFWPPLPNILTYKCFLSLIPLLTSPFTSPWDLKFSPLDSVIIGLLPSLHPRTPYSLPPYLHHIHFCTSLGFGEIETCSREVEGSELCKPKVAACRPDVPGALKFNLLEGH